MEALGFCRDEGESDLLVCVFGLADRGCGRRQPESLTRFTQDACSCGEDMSATLVWETFETVSALL